MMGKRTVAEAEAMAKAIWDDPPMEWGGQSGRNLLYRGHLAYRDASPYDALLIREFHDAGLFLPEEQPMTMTRLGKMFDEAG